MIAAFNIVAKITQMKYGYKICADNTSINLNHFMVRCIKNSRKIINNSPKTGFLNPKKIKDQSPLKSN